MKIYKYLKENRSCGYSLFILFLFAVGIVDEVYTALLGEMWIIVQDSYLSDMFSAIIAISTLGNAIQALIMGSFNDRILGLTVKEVVQLPACEVKMSYTIKATAVMVLVALCSLAFELYALITVTLIATLFLIAITSIQIWRLLSSEQVVKEIILAAVKSDNTENMPSFFNLSFIVNRLFDELADAIVSDDGLKQDKYIKLIKEIVNTSPKGNTATQLLHQKTAKLFGDACFALGFVDAYNRILCFNKEEAAGEMDVDQIAFDFIEQIKYIPPKDISAFNIPQTIRDIVETAGNDNPIMIRCAYYYTYMLSKNTVIDEEAKQEILAKVFDVLCLMRDGQPGKNRRAVLLLFIRNAVFLNEKASQRESVFQTFVCQFHAENLYFNDEECFISVLTELFRALFFYCYFETETLSDEYRSALAKLFCLEVQSKDTIKVSFASMVCNNSSNIVRYLSNEMTAMIPRERSLFDYYPSALEAKSVVWCEKNLLLFLFCFSICTDEIYILQPLYDYIKTEEHELDNRIMCCRTIVHYFSEDGTIIPSVATMLLAMQNCLGITNSIQMDGYAWYFDMFNNQLKNLVLQRNAKNSIDKETTDLLGLNSMMCEELSKKLLGKEPTEQIARQMKQFSIMPMVSCKQDISEKNTALLAATAAVYMVRRIISDTLPQLELSFDQTGVDTLLNYICNDKYLTRTFTFVNDLALSADVRKSKSYQELKQRLEEIQLLKMPGLNIPVLLRTFGYQYNAKIVKYTKEKPTADECERYIRRFEVAEGKYRINDIVFNYSDAMEYTSTQCMTEKLEIAVAVDIDKDSGWQIKFVLPHR